MNFLKKNRSKHGFAALLMAVTLFITPLTSFTQTKVSAPGNRYSVSDDVKLGQQAAAEVEQKLPILRDASVTDYVQDVGRRLASAIPSEFQHPEFRYTFRVVDAPDINAFALPGGPMYVNRGMIDAARTEGEMAGVMAHELSHVALRHGTAQATKAGGLKAQAPAILGGIAGAILGGTIGGIAQTAGQLGSAAIVTKYSREYETQADILGAQIMARAGYNPRDLANMFRTIEQQSGGGRGGPEWLSTHPNPGNRYERINREAEMLRVSGSGGNSGRFNEIKGRLRGMPRGSVARGQNGNQNGNGNERIQGQVERPSTRYRNYTGGNVFQLSVPENWREVGGESGSVTFAPEGGYGNVQNSFVFTHGVQVGVARVDSNNLQQATEQYIEELLQANPYLQQQRGYQRGNVSGRTALATTLSGRSNVTRQDEVVNIYTSLMDGGELFYMISVAPRQDYNLYQSTFSSVLRSIQLAGSRGNYR
ncbi:MAG: M48 family metallopeptidase [Pyrinomonadaceae bacterium]